MAPFTIFQAIAALGAVVSAVGAVQQGKAQKQQADLQARLLEQQAERERQLAERDAGEFARDQRRLQGRQRLQLAATNLEIGEGTPISIAENTAAEIEFQRQRILGGGAAAATRLTSQAALTRSAGSAARRAGFVRGGARLLQGAGQAYALGQGGGQAFG